MKQQESNSSKPELRTGNLIAEKHEHRNGMGTWYHKRLAEIYRFHVAPNQHVLEIGCGDGNLLASLQPAQVLALIFLQA